MNPLSRRKFIGQVTGADDPPHAAVRAELSALTRKYAAGLHAAA